MERKLKGTTEDYSTFHPRDKRSPRHSEWRRNIQRGLRKGKARRLKAGLLTPREISARSWLGLSSIYGMLDSGELPCVKVGNRRYAKESDFAKLLKRIGVEEVA